MAQTATPEGDGVAPEERTIVVAAARNGSLIVPEGDIDEHRRSILDGKLIVFRGVFDAGEMIRLRRSVQAWSEAVPEFPRGESASRPSLNFHRRDSGLVATSMPHVFHQFGFGDLNSLPREIADLVTPISEALLALQNELAGTRFEIAKAGLRTKVIRHPRGGGFLAAHSHPFLPQRISVFLNLSEPAADYASGGAAYKTSGLWIAPFEDFRIGNLLAWRYDLTHQVLPVDPGEPLKWEGDDGFWLYGLEMDEVHKHSKLAD